MYDIYENFDYRSQIVGGHGTGKTTFLVDFVRFLLEKGHAVNHFSLHDGQKFLSHEFWERQISLVSQFKIGTPAKPPLAVVDGYEQLAWTQKMRLRRICRKGVAGLLITTHKPAWSMPVLVKTGPTVETLLAVVAYLFRDSPDLEPPDPALCHSLFERHRGNIRNALFELYDHYEMTTDASMERR